MPSVTEPANGATPAWQPVRPRRRLFPLIVSWLATGVALMVAAGLLPGMHIDDFGGALLIAVIVAALNAVIPPVLAALRLPAMLVLGFLLVLIADAVILLLAADATDGVLSIDCGAGGKLVVNRHVPNREIWVAARSGGFHFHHDAGSWRDTRSGQELGAALSELLRLQADVAIAFPVLPAI